MTIEKQLQVGFALAAIDDYDALDEKERARLKQKVDSVIRNERRDSAGLRATYGARRATDEDLLVLSRVLRDQLYEAATGVPNAHLYNVSLGTIFVPGGSVILTVVEGSTVDRFLLLFWLGLASVGLARLRRCVCGRPFLKTGRRIGCDNPACIEQRRKEYWDHYKHTPNARRARQKFYARQGWTLGARRHRKTKQRKGGQQ